ncbi:MAG: hypothetical protein ACRD3G_22055 [Vicinamibacterales bacterium]
MASTHPPCRTACARGWGPIHTWATSSPPDSYVPDTPTTLATVRMENEATHAAITTQPK